MLHDEHQARLPADESAGAGEIDQRIPDWDEIVLHLRAASGDELTESRNSHSNSAWANLIAALVEQQRSGAAKGD